MLIQFLSGLSLQLLKLLHNCEDHFLFNALYGISSFNSEIFPPSLPLPLLLRLLLLLLLLVPMFAEWLKGTYGKLAQQTCVG